MKTINVRQLIDLVEGGSDSGESCVQKIFEWQFERNMSVARWALGLSASLAIAITISYLSSETDVSVWEFGLGFFLSLVSATYGIYVLVRLRLMSTQYTAALSLYSKLKRIDEFILKYRS